MTNIYYEPNSEELKSNRRWFQNVKLIGEIDNGTSLYIEDYVYTYLYQYASSDLSCEQSAVLIGEYYEQVDQVVIYGVIPIGVDFLTPKSKWISQEVLDRLKHQKEQYFPKGEYVGWMHTQPGYGIMLTTQEINVHKEVFGDQGILLLIDPIHKVETFFASKESGLVEKLGYCMYYERNEQMQQYMIDYPIIEKQKGEVNDLAVANFREMGARRKREVERRKKMNMIVSITVASLLLMAAFMTGIYEQQRKISELEKNITSIYEQYSTIKYKLNDSPIELVFNEQTAINSTSEAGPVSETVSETVSVVESSQEIKPLEKKADQGEQPEQPEQKEQKKQSEQSEKAEQQVEYDIYAVQTGDSLLDISYKHYKTVKMANKIAEINSITNKDTIYIGQKLKLPKVSK